MIVGVVGCGYWGPNLVRNLIELNRCDEVLCLDTRAEAVAKVCRRYPSVIAAANFDELVSRCDAVMLATPVSTHFALAKAVLEAGKSVFVEKPLTNSVNDAMMILHLENQSPGILMVGHTFVYSPPVRKVKEYISTGVLGDVYFVSSSRINLGIHRQDVNVIWDLAPHDLSILIYWLEQTPSRVAAFGRACVGALADVASIHCEFPSGVIANLEVSWLSPSKLRRTMVVGSRRMVIYDDTLGSEKLKLYDSNATLRSPESFGEYQLTYRNGDLVSPYLESTEPLVAQTSHFLDCVQSKARPNTDVWFGLQVVQAAEAACRSMQEEDGRFVEVRPLAAAVSAGSSMVR